jgi:hypothetical protein
MKKEEESIDGFKKSLEMLKNTLVILEKAEKTDKADWKPSREYTHEEHAKLQPWIMAGFHPREAAHMAGVEKSGSSSIANVRSTHLSEPMMELARKVAQKHINRYMDERGEASDPSKNPVINAEHNYKKISSNLTDDYGKSLNDLKSSDEFNSMSHVNKLKAINDHKRKFYSSNLDNQKQKAADVAKQVGDIHRANTDAREKELYEQRKNVLHGGVGMPVDPASLASYQPEYDDEEPEHEDLMEG